MSKSAFTAGEILIPKENLEKWSVVACDQFTSDPGYWQSVEQLVGEAPSTVNIIFPEAYLGRVDFQERIGRINAAMDDYRERGLFTRYENAMIYLERTLANGAVRRGIVGLLDLEDYDYRPGAPALVRATEGTVLDRIPPRVQIRQNASLEAPHVMTLIDDPAKELIEPLAGRTHTLQQLYDFPLMLGGGRATGYLLPREEVARVTELLGGRTILVGDGNHSLATAKECYRLRPTEKTRYALVELCNLHDPSLVFEPIHRAVFEADSAGLLEALEGYCRAGAGSGIAPQQFTVVTAAGERSFTLEQPTEALTVGSVQRFLDGYLTAQGGRVDYIHGEEQLRALAQGGAVCFLLDVMEKSQLLPAVLRDGVLPRKTFSMGEAADKRYYLECRSLK